MPASPRNPEEPARPATSGYLSTDCPPCPECGSIQVAEKIGDAVQVTLRCLNCQPLNATARPWCRDCADHSGYCPQHPRPPAPEPADADVAWLRALADPMQSKVIFDPRSECGDRLRLIADHLALNKVAKVEHQGLQDRLAHVTAERDEARGAMDVLAKQRDDAREDHAEARLEIAVLGREREADAAELEIRVRQARRGDEPGFCCPNCFLHVGHKVGGPVCMEAAAVRSAGVAALAEAAALRAAIEPGTAAGRLEAALDDAVRLGFTPNVSSGPDGDPIHFLVGQVERLQEVAAELLRQTVVECDLETGRTKFLAPPAFERAVRLASAAVVTTRGSCLNYREHGLVCGQPTGHEGDCGPVKEAPHA